MKIYEKYLSTLKSHANKQSELRFAANQLLEMHAEAMSRTNPIIVELGVDKGQSTRIFLNAISEKSNSRLISVDIRDCKDAVKSDKWEFVQQNSVDVDLLLSKKPILKNGIDILYVDSLHTESHVLKEIYGFFEYIKPNGLIFFDDIDSGPYMSGQRKDSINTEIDNRKIFNLLEAIFRANYSSIDFSIHRGSTGLAKFKKRSALGDKLKDPIYIGNRRLRLFWRFLEIINLKKSYRHNNDTNDSFLINPNDD
ncbi:class I SAM-dependent methyltransferase [Candidatus Pelagibacter bacterium]|nr:class I SAM-dependent methyltransferase [Candidatus Pelagibacter bacterium]